MAFGVLRCPNCDDQLLESLPTALGTIERCPNCQRLFIEEKTLADYSEDKADCYNALEEARSLLLPTSRHCPQCGQPLQDARIKSRNLILTLCTQCKALWTDTVALERFSETTERAV